MTDGIKLLAKMQIVGKRRDHIGGPGVWAQTTIRAKRQRLLALLKNRYSYTNEQAVDEMERLLKQFDRTNRSLGIRQKRSN